jgi:hypothetical protein
MAAAGASAVGAVGAIGAVGSLRGGHDRPAAERAQDADWHDSHRLAQHGRRPAPHFTSTGRANVAASGIATPASV